MLLNEMSASLYAWDLADEGIESILDNLQEAACVNSVYLIGLMHLEKRPLTDFFFPHNPVRKTYFVEDSRIYWHADASFYRNSPIKPRPSERAFLSETDWLKVLVDSARKRGLRTGVELSHTFLDAQRASEQFASAVQHDIYGQRLGKLLCFNSPDAREYATALFVELASRYDVDYIQTCLIPFSAGQAPRGANSEAGKLLATTLGGCFCEHCIAAAGRAGLDLAKIRSDLRPLADALSRPSLEQSHEMALVQASNVSPVELIMQNPSLYQWLVFRRDTLAAFFGEIHRRVHAVRSGIDLRLNAYISANQELSGLDLRAMRPHLDSIRSSDYSEQSGDPERLEFKRRWLLAVRRAVGDEMPFLSAIGVRPKATPELIRHGVLVSCQCGVDGITIGHYDGAPFSHLRAIREGLELADATVAPPRKEPKP